MQGLVEGKSLEDLDARELNELGNAYDAQGMSEEAIDSYLRSLAMRKSSGDVRGQGIVLNNLGATYYSRGRVHEALESYEASYEIAHDQGEELSELIALMNLVFLHFEEGSFDEFQRRADEAEALALELDRWEPMAKLRWLRGRLAISGTDRFQEGLSLYSEALDYASRQGEAELQEMLDRVDVQAQRLASQGARGLALVFYDYLELFARDHRLGESVLSHLSQKREEILRAPSLS
ncbi:MAG: tetratricopeptide repeat protein [Anaerolineae bacterium]|nr:tetratricopeptide repeat protein [Anaerolineae bacterium]